MISKNNFKIFQYCVMNLFFDYLIQRTNGTIHIPNKVTPWKFTDRVLVFNKTVTIFDLLDRNESDVYATPQG